MRVRLSHLWLLLFSPLAVAAADKPADTYFAVAVTENSHNHVGHNLLFLDFQQRLDSAGVSPQVVVSPYAGKQAPLMDGELSDWRDVQLSRVQGRVMNNYPLSEFYDAVPTEIRVGSAWDEEYIYFVVDFEDANHDASINRNRWHFDGKKWRKQAHAKTGAATPAAAAINRNDTLSGNESEDRVFFMFPIVDQQGSFRDGGNGCANYCHANLMSSGDPTKHAIGAEVAAMHTSVEGDRADIWHWTATRSRPMNSLKDGHLVYGEKEFNGRKADAGTPPDRDNSAKAEKFSDKDEPAWISKTDYAAGNYAKQGFRTEILRDDDLLRLTPDMRIAKGVSLPYSVNQRPSGSRADVTAVAQFNDDTKRWTVEFKRRRDTGDANDYQFIAGADAAPPTTAALVPGDAVLGEKLFKENCESCHGEEGRGKFEHDHWTFPRNQRASGALIAKTASLDRPKRANRLAWQKPKGDNHHEMHVMAFVPITQQEAEHIAAWLQQQIVPAGK